jgi:hypothetical protein
VTDDGVKAIAATLFRCPPPMRTALAQRLYPRGVRIHPELATTTLVAEGPENLGNWRPQHLEKIEGATDVPHEEKLSEARALAKLLTDIPRHDMRPALANDMFQQGARIHPELATAGPAVDDSAQPQGFTRHDPLEIVRFFTPELAERIANADTEAQRTAIREEIRHKHGSKIAEIADQIEKLQ